jgi:hypothetical protein
MIYPGDIVRLAPSVFQMYVFEIAQGESMGAIGMLYPPHTFTRYSENMDYALSHKPLFVGAVCGEGENTLVWFMGVGWVQPRNIEEDFEVIM